ncbi:translocation/assembly module TamB domain-containing protein [Cylindrospermum sp. FACHB-282]|uniref:translocation/assembly module TamB domain-containing protein n=1 Tax=Cylindrospermum sp. FACHB-282 TaxID=2692794 RepID=UPI0016871A82|nr:translocation/assembly module TamB domain-containing protein [Cylindrospermum sp. FACHB-282]MBD2387165.1 translocation/assembly module TamB domain-containing protein [Cylindrospermum sp. FACHB-282]
MTNSNDSHSPSPTGQRLWLMILTRGGIALGGLLLVGIIGGIWRLWTFVQKELAPLAETNLTTTLNRPVKLGAVTDFSLTGLRFAASSIPATPTDPDKATIEAVEVGFDPVKLIVNRQLKLDVTLVNPDVYIEQDQQGSWISTTIAPPGKAGLIKTDLDKLRFRNGKLLLLPQRRVARGQGALSRALLAGGQAGNSPNRQSPIANPRYSVAFSQLNGTAQLLNNNKLIRLDLVGSANTGGNIAIKGDLRPNKVLDGNLKLQAKGLLAADITRLIKLPFILRAGRVNGDLQVQLIPNQETLLHGSADVQGVTLRLPSVPQGLSNTQGKIGFRGLEVRLDQVATNYGKIPLVATGIIDRVGGFQLAGRVKAVSLANAAEALKVKLPVPASGLVKVDLQIVGSISQPVLSGTVTTLKTAKIDKVDFQTFSSKFRFSPSAALITLNDIQGKLTLGGDVRGAGTIGLGTVPRLDFNFTANNLPGDAIAKVYDITSSVQVGTVSATAQLTGPASNVQTSVQWRAPRATYPASGETIIAADRTVSFRNVAVNVAGGVVRADGRYVDQRWQAVAQASGIPLTPFVDQKQLQNVSLAGSQFNGRLIISGTTAPLKVETIRTDGAAVQIGGGTVAISNIQIKDQNFAAQLVANGVRLGRIFKQSPPALSGPLAGAFQILGNTENFSLKTLYANGQGRLAIDGGVVTASNIQLAEGRYQGQIQVNNVPLQRLVAVPPQLRGGLAGQFNVAGSIDSFNPQRIQATGQALLKVAGGTVTASNIQLAEGRYQAIVKSSGVQLNRLNQQLQGQLGGQMQLSGLVGSAKLADVRAAGDLQLSQGIPGLQSPLKAAIAWDGQKLTLNQVTSTNLNASGYILADAQKPGIPEITQLNLSIQAQNYNLQQLPVKLPSSLGVVGKVDFSGLVAGKLLTPNVTGKLGLRDFAVRNFAFEPLLAGNVTLVQGSGLTLDLAGKKDRIAVNLDSKNRPQSFLVQWQQALATGQAQGDNWGIKVANFPLATLNLVLPANTALGNNAVAGLLTGDVQFNQQTLAAKGNLAIAKPEIGRINGDRISTQFSYNNGKATLTDSEFVKGDSRYTFNGTISQTAQLPQVQGKINIAQGNIQDFLTAAQIFEIQDLQRGLKAPTYGTSADLTTTPQGLPNQPLLSQIQRLFEIDALLAEQEQKRLASKPIPDLTDLKGIFNGEISIDTATANGLGVQFNLNGQNFSWGKESEPSRFYRADKVIAEGGFEKGVLRLQPLRIEADNRLIAFTGNIGGEEQSGQLRINNFPIEVLNNFIKLPVGITGNVDATAVLAGSIANPQARGELQITEGTINQKKVESATAGFSYADGRLNFGSTLLASGPEPVNVNGSIPYKLPFAAVEPDNNQISLDVKVKNEGLALLNLLTNQVAFEKGEGEIDIKVRGTRQQPLVNGIATVNSATFSAQALPGKLRRVTGKVQFDFDRILVESLQGRFSRGKVEVAGAIPIFNNQGVKIDNPLTVNLDQLIINLKGLYQGGASGNLQITGSLLNPIIGGNIDLFNGQVLLSESSTSNQSEKGNVNSLPATANTQNKVNAGDNAITKLDNLEISLGKKVKVSRPPILDFLATGNLSVNGSLSDPIPEGTIKLTQGGVNLFTTQFNLARGYEQTATFRANQPRDPILDVRLFAKVLDVIQSSEIGIGRQGSTGLAALEGVRVEASVKGPASKINDNLELKSNPARSQTEIVSLLGGGFVDTQGRGDSTLGLINIAGSAVFNNFQGTFNQIGDALGLSELRLFPTIISENPEAGRNNSSLELALEAGVDISTKISVSSIKILTASDPFQWGVNYRISDEIRLRASTNLTNDSRAIVEFERRF